MEPIMFWEAFLHETHGFFSLKLHKLLDFDSYAFPFLGTAHRALYMFLPDVTQGAARCVL